MDQATRLVFLLSFNLRKKNGKVLLTDYIGDIFSFNIQYECLLCNLCEFPLINYPKNREITVFKKCRREKVNNEVNKRFVSEKRKFSTAFDCVVSFFGLICYLICAIVVLRFDRLKICGDIEPNPGPEPVNVRVSTSEKPSIQVATYNVRGLGDKKKVRHLINSCHKQCGKAHDSIFMFQETFVERLDILDYIWRGEFHLTPGTGQSLGCLTLLSSPFKIITSQELDGRGHVLVVTKDNVNKAELIIANIYAPNGLGTDKIDFFENVVQTVLELKATHDCDATIVAGDFNLVFNNDEVKNRSIPNNEKRLANSVTQMFSTAELTDGWSAAGAKDFTWTSSRNGKPIFSTLDRILFSDTKLTLKTKKVDWSLSLSDHAMVLATFMKVVSNRKPCNFIPRLDPRILQDKDACRILDQEFQTLMDNASVTWSPHVALEYCKMSIRTAVFATTGVIKARFRNEEKELNENINGIVNELAQADDNSPRQELLIHKLEDLRGLKRHLVEKIGSKIEQRTARNWHNEGELSNKYFFNLLNRRTNEEINSLLIDNEQCDDGPMIEEAIRGFYKDLYESVGVPRAFNDNFFRHVNPVEEDAANGVV